MTHLEPYLVTTLNRLQTAVNAILAFQRINFAKEFGKAEGERKRNAALNTVQATVLTAAETIGIRPQERAQLLKEIEELRDQLNAFRFTNARLMDQIDQLTAANVRLMQGRTA